MKRELKSNQIAGTALVRGKIIGENNIIEHGAIIYENTIIGSSNHIFPYAIIGSPAEHREKKSRGRTIIGNDNIIREFTTIQGPANSISTVVGNNNYIMNKVHIGHDAIIGNNCNIAPFSTIGGNVVIGDHTFVGIAVAIRQYIKVGKGCMIGMNATLIKDVPDYRTVVGIGRILGYNIRGMKKRGMTDKEIEQLILSIELKENGKVTLNGNPIC